MVGSSRPGALLTSNSSARVGGSSSTLSSALAPSRCRSSTASTMAMRQPPSPAVEPKNGTAAAHVVDADHGVELAGLLVDDALEHQQIALRLRGDAARDRMVGVDRERGRLLHLRRGRIGMRQHEARETIGQRRLADAGRAADQPGMRNAPALVACEQRRSASAWPNSAVVSRGQLDLDIGHRPRSRRRALRHARALRMQALLDRRPDALGHDVARRRGRR